MLRLTVLIENSAPDHLIAEHGLSLHLDYEGHSYLLDSGTSGLFVRNADRLGIDLSRVERAALSHGHDDHAGGFSAFFRRNQQAPVLARPAAVQAYQEDTADPSRRPAGVDPDLFTKWAGRFDLADGPRLLAPGLHLIPDAVSHEQSLVAETAHGLVVMNSCCHAGAAHIVHEVRALFPTQKVHAIVGGFHLVGKTGMGSLGVAPEQVRLLSRRLAEELEVEQICTGHCTGHPAFDLMAQPEPGCLIPLHTGTCLSF